MPGRRKPEAIEAVDWIILDVLQNEIKLVALTLRRLFLFLAKHLVQVVDVLVGLHEV